MIKISEIKLKGPLELIYDYLESLPSDCVIRFSDLPLHLQGKSHSLPSQFSKKYKDNTLKCGRCVYLGSRKAIAAAKKMHGIK
jgi:hypothetical protein